MDWFDPAALRAAAKIARETALQYLPKDPRARDLAELADRYEQRALALDRSAERRAEEETG